MPATCKGNLILDTRGLKDKLSLGGLGTSRSRARGQLKRQHQGLLWGLTPLQETAALDSHSDP